MDESDREESAVTALSTLIMQHGKGNPPRLRLDHLAAKYDQLYGKFPTCELGKLKKFVVQHFQYDPSNQEVSCKTRRRKKSNKCEATEAEGIGTPYPGNGGPGKDVVPVRAQPAANSSPMVDRRAVSAEGASTAKKDVATVVEVPEVLDTLSDLKDQVDSVLREMATKEDIEKSVARLREDLAQDPKKTKQIESEAEKFIPKWNEWKMLEDECMAFDKFSAQFLLIAGVVPESEAQYIGLLRKVKWHAIIDLDPNSESSGLHKAFALDEDQQCLPDMWVPSRVLSLKSSELADEINRLRSPWMFARGRNNDCQLNRPRSTFNEWTHKWLGPINRFLAVVAERLDEHVPIVTLLLPFDGSNNAYMKELLTRLDQELGSRNASSSKYIILDTRTETKTYEVPLDPKTLCPSTNLYQLPANLFSFGLAVCLGCAPKNARLMPTTVAGADAIVEESDFLYLSEFLTLLYKGCENEQLGQNPDAIGDERRDEIIEEHKRAFLSGQTISFISLHYSHDATRDDLQNFRSNIHKYMDQRPMPLSTVVDFAHHPGTGGSTLTRRTLWELHLEMPCAIVKSNLKVHTAEEEDEFTSNVCKRILTLEELCCRAPIILIDGETSVFRRTVLSRTIADRLSSRGSKALILHCFRASEREVKLNVIPYGLVLKTELSPAEKKRFMEKYGESTTDSRAKNLSRTFHFPLCAFVKEFKERMKGIVAMTVDKLSENETNVIRFVALMQVFAGQPVPMSLILKLFLDETQMRRRLCYNTDDGRPWCPTYEEIYNSFSDDLRVLLVQSPRIGRQGERTCDLQHVIVAQQVLRKLFGESSKYYGRLELYLEELMSMDKLLHIDRKYVPLFEDLFLHNKDVDPKISFSVVIEMLKTRLPSKKRAGMLLKLAASVFPSARFYSHVARYFVYIQPRNFELAEEMIVAGFGALKPRESKTILHEMRGIVSRIRLADLVESDGVSSIQELEVLASKSLQEYNQAITSPPSRPNPLLGKVQVWIKCLEWIAKNKCGEVAEVVRYLSTEAPEFFRHMMSEAFHHLDIIEQLLVTHTVTDVDFTQYKVTDCKMKLCFVQTKSRGKAHGSRRRQRHHLVAECEKLSKDPELAHYTQRELRRLKVCYLLDNDSYGLKLEALEKDDIKYLYGLLRELVDIDKEYRFTSRLIRVAMCLSSQDSLSLDEALDFVQSWQTFSSSDPYVHFYSFVLYFLKVLEGHVVDYGAKYEESLRKCRELSYSYINRTNVIFYLGKGGPGLTALVDRSAFKISSTDDFWQKKSRETLLEVEGRVKKKSTGRRKSLRKTEIYFELKSGIRVDLGRNQMSLAGELGRDYHLDQLVRFVVSFNLAGLTAHGFVYV